MKRAALPVAEEEGIEGARTLGEVAYRRLRTDIVMVRLEPDQPLRFDALKAHYGLGVSPLREALSRLAEERLVTTVGQRGYRFCLDDLGSGANSFHYLRSIPVDFVKIDGAFGRDALQNERDRSFLRYVSGFCRENGILAIAEMIETEAQAEGYRELGIDYGQGYLFGRPLILRPSA